MNFPRLFLAHFHHDCLENLQMSPADPAYHSTMYIQTYVAAKNTTNRIIGQTLRLMWSIS